MCNACAALCTCCGKITKWIIIAVIIFFTVTIITSCILLLGPDDEPSSTSSSPTVQFDLLQDSVIFKAMGSSKEPPYPPENLRQLPSYQQ
ncbi:uncharacterized protein LOC116919540 [Daphnia magna]|uniref:Uncharacterized protein n=1 Tax=Daphnia magna TaxID=35525 RepID=A0A162D5C2_9CRUS|nr:uncharacterized protein LOC116919540 [Daphnia magna]KZS07134.1 Uncharacterized protein APZ42_029294 [Daphnia magna]